MRHCDDNDVIAFSPEVDRVRELLQQCSADIAMYNRELFAILAHHVNDAIDLQQECYGRLFIAFQIPIEGRVYVATRKATDLDAHH